MPADGVVRSVMRSQTDVQYWGFTAPAAGTYTIRLSDQAVPYKLAYWAPGTSGSTYSSSTADRVKTLTLAAGAQVQLAVSVINGRVSLTEPYTLTVTMP